MSFSICTAVRSYPLPTTTAGSARPMPKSAEAEFLEYAQMTPAERMRADILEEMGITEEELALMDDEVREKIEEEIRERIKQKVEDSAEAKTGMILDVTA